MSIGAFAALFSASARESVFDDAAYWLYGPKDLNGDGVLNKGDCPDVRHLSDISHPLNQALGDGVCWDAEYATFQTMQVVHPFAMLTNQESCLVLKQPVNGSDKISPVALTLPSLFELSDQGSYSAVMRFKWDGPTHEGATSWLIGLGLGDGESGAGGVTFGLSSSGNVISYFYVGDMQTYGTDPALAIRPGAWVDLAFVVDRGTIAVYRMIEGDGMSAGAWSIWTGDLPENVKKSNRTASCFHIGSSGNTLPIWEVTYQAYPTAWCVFRGAIQQAAIWPRALSQGEVAEAFGMDSMKLRCGSFDGASDEFDGTSNEIMPLSPEDWRNQVPMLTSDAPSVSYSFELFGSEALLPQELDFGVVDATLRGKVALNVNGVDVGESDVSSGHAHHWFPAQTFQAGDNVLTITWRGEGDLAIDAVQLGGSWQVGYEDNSTAEFLPTINRYRKDYYLMGPDTWSSRVNPGVTTDVGYEECIIHFNMPESLATRSRYRLEIPCRTGWSEDGSERWVDVVVNGETRVRRKVRYGWGDTISVDLPENGLKGGENEVVFRCDNEVSSSLAFDCVRLSIKHPRTGFGVVVR